jgi:formate transporter
MTAPTTQPGRRRRAAGPERTPPIYGGLDAYAPDEVARRVEEIGVTKARLPAAKTFMLGVMAGGFVGLGAIYFTVVTSDPSLDFAARGVLGGVVFSLGYSVAIIAGAEVFTSSKLLVMTWAARRIRFVELARNWGIVLLANAVGAIGLIVLTLLSGVMGHNEGLAAVRAVEIAATKASLPFVEAFFRGVLGNLFVCIAVWIAMAGRSVTDKMLAMLLPISAVAALNLEHIVASLYFLPRGVALLHIMPELAGPETAALTWFGIWPNFLAVTLGNIVGGSLMVAAAYWIIYRRRGGHGADAGRPRV